MAKGKSKTENGKSEQEKLKEKQDAFRRVVTPRVNKAVKAIGLVGLCASKNYSYSPEQANAIVQAMQAAVDQCKKLFTGEQVTQGWFTLPK